MKVNNYLTLIALVMLTGCGTSEWDEYQSAKLRWRQQEAEDEARRIAEQNKRQEERQAHIAELKASTKRIFEESEAEEAKRRAEEEAKVAAMSPEERKAKQAADQERVKNALKALEGFNAEYEAKRKAENERYLRVKEIQEAIENAMREQRLKDAEELRSLLLRLNSLP